jgi:hypothetical protein
MSYQSDINDAIADNVPLTALIGTGFSWDIADPETSPPYLIAQTISSDGTTDFDGNRGVSFPLVQFSAWATSKAAAITIISTLKTAIEGQNLPGSSNSSLSFAGENSTRDPQTKLYGEIVDYRVSCNTN